MPQALVSKLPEKAKEIYESAYSSAKSEGKDEETAAKIAMGAVKNAGFAKNEETGMWTKASEEDEFTVDLSEEVFTGMVFGEELSTKDMWVEAACTGTVTDMHGKMVTISEQDIDQWVKAYQENVRGQELPITFDHPRTGGVAAGWFRGLRKGPKRIIRGKPRDTLLMKPEWTPRGRRSVDDKDYQYLSVEILPGNHLRGASLVNYPAVKGLYTVGESVSPFAEFYLSEMLLQEKSMADENKKEAPGATKCVKCGLPVPEGSKACPGCGAPVATEEKKEKPKVSEDQKDFVSTEDFKALAERLSVIEEARTSLAEENETLKTQLSHLSEQNEAQSEKITGLVDLNNMLRLHEKVVVFMQLGEHERKAIAPAYEEKIIEIMLAAPGKEAEILSLLEAIAAGNALVEFGERGTSASPEPLGTEDESRSKMHEKVLKMSENEDITYKEAFTKLLEQEVK